MLGISNVRCPKCTNLYKFCLPALSIALSFTLAITKYREIIRKLEMVHGKCLVTGYSLSDPGVGTPASSLIACLDEVLMKMENVSDRNFNLNIHSGMTWKHHQNWRLGGGGSVANCVPVLLLRPHEGKPTRLLCPGDFPGKNTRVGCHFLLQGIFPT